MTTMRVSLVVIALFLGQAGASVAQTVDDLFNPAGLHDVRLVLHSSDWQNLKNNFLDNTYYPTDLSWGGVTVRNVGIRSRGLGSRSPVKPGLRVDFDRYASGQRFLGEKSIILDNLTQDPSMMREVLSMSLFIRLGLPAPREAFVRLYVNNTLVGLYAVVESIDKQFLARVFNQDNGNLFEYDYTIDYNFEYLGPDLEPYAVLFSPKTNETHPKFELYDPIERMVRAVNQTADAAFEGVMTQFLDLAMFMKHVAVEIVRRRERRIARLRRHEQLLSLSVPGPSAVSGHHVGQGQRVHSSRFPAVPACRPKRADAAGADDSGRATGVPRWRDRRRRQRR